MRVRIRKILQFYHLQNALEMATISSIAIIGMEPNEAPTSLIMSEKDTYSPSTVVLNGGSRNGGRPAVMLPVTRKG